MIKGDINLTGDAVFEAESVIVGNLNTDNLELSGKIKGNIKANGNVVVSDSVFGNISCDNLILQNEDLSDSEITAKGHVIIENGVSVKGQVKCRDITIYGKLGGNAEAKEKAEIGEEGVFAGELKAGSFGVHPGAKITGAANVSGQN